MALSYHSTDIRLLSLSSGGPHPLAAVPNLNDSLDIQSPDEWTFDIKVRGKYLGIMIFNEGEERSSTEFRIWNWKTGDLNSVCEATWSQQAFLSYISLGCCCCGIRLVLVPHRRPRDDQCN